MLILQGAEDRQTPLRAGEILHKQLAQSELNVFRHGVLPGFNGVKNQCCSAHMVVQVRSQPDA